MPRRVGDRRERTTGDRRIQTAELNRVLALLTSFDGGVPALPARLDWPLLAETCERHGLAPIVSYQLEYRWPGRFGAPGWLRERLLAGYQGVLSDNVFKLVQLKQALGQAGMPEVILLGAAAAADAFYPHIAFRPVPELELLARPRDLPAVQAAFGERGFQPLETGSSGITVGDGRLSVQFHTALPGFAHPEPLFSRKVAAMPYGPRAFRLGPEDAFLATAASLAREAFLVPRIQLIDLREMALRGARGGEGFWDPQGGAPLDAARLQARARESGLARPLCCALELLAACFPEAEAAARTLAPPLPARTRALLSRAVVGPALDPQRRSTLRGAQAVRRALLRGGIGRRGG
ncbi:MAG: nucleotidyltransferase family protein [Myxococcales bacterium]